MEQGLTEECAGRVNRKHLDGGRWIAKLILALACIALSLLAGEGLVRFFTPQSLILLRPDIWVSTGQVGWGRRPSVDTRVNTGEREVRWKTDDQGFRIGANLLAVSDMTLVALGDSTVEALQVEHEETMTSLLENRLASRCGKSLRILNAGVGGWTPNQYRIELERILGIRSVDGVLVFVSLANDIIEARVDSYRPREAVKRHSLRFPKGLGWSELVEAIAFPINDFLEVRSHLFILAKNRLQYALMRVGLTASYFPKALLTSQASSERWKTTANILEEIAVIAKHHNLQTLFVLIPSPSEADFEKGQRTAKAFGLASGTFNLDQAHLLLGEEIRHRNLAVVDTTSALRAAIAKRIPDVYGQVDTHLGKQGHQVVAEATEDSVWEIFCLGRRAFDSGRSHLR
jgi:lysophospholipase L1-like esterase